MLCLVILCFGAFIEVVGTREFSEVEYYHLPQLFHLDDQERCFSQQEGLYCVGTFYVTPFDEDNPVYHLMQEYSSEPHKFNRTLLHRGYCVTSRCPENNTLQSHLQRFVNCAEKIVSKELSLHTHLDKLDYCRTRDEGEVVVDGPKWVFIFVCCGLLIMNAVGTVYDMMTKNKGKIEMLIIWSVRKNWEQLTSIHTQALNTSLAALHGVRAIVTITICISHAALIHFTAYTYNPRALEEIVSHPLVMLIQNSTAVEQMLFVMSGFLHTFQLKKRSDVQTIGFSTTLVLIAKRIFRLYPVYILTVGFATTWWPDLSDGPMWPALVGVENNICRRKFWSHALFINNLVEPQSLCVLTTWYMAVDFQLHVISTIILVALSRLPVPKLPVLVILFISSCLLNAGLAYTFDWMPMLYLTTAPENLRNLFRDQPSFSGLYVSPWGNLPACFLGAILGYLYYEMKGRKFDFVRHKMALIVCSSITFSLLTIGVLLGYYIQYIKIKGVIVAFTALERCIYQLLLLITYAMINFMNGFIMRVLSWRGWHAMSRMSYSVMLVHWIVTLHIVASSPRSIPTSVMYIIADGCITALYTFLLAVPITVLIEFPMKNFFETLTP